MVNIVMSKLIENIKPIRQTFYQRTEIVILASYKRIVQTQTVYREQYLNI